MMSEKWPECITKFGEDIGTALEDQKKQIDCILGNLKINNCSRCNTSAKIMYACNIHGKYVFAMRCKSMCTNFSTDNNNEAVYVIEKWNECNPTELDARLDRVRESLDEIMLL